MTEADAAEAAFTRLVDRLRRGDEVAFHAVYRSVQPALLRYLTVLVGISEAEDVASETWAQVFRDLHTFTGDGDGFLDAKTAATVLGRRPGAVRTAAYRGLRTLARTLDETASPSAPRVTASVSDTFAEPGAEQPR